MRMEDSEQFLQKKFKLTGKQARFVIEYAVSFNATQSALKAGYTANIECARVIGCESLIKVNVAAALDYVKAERAERCKIDGDWIISRLKMIVERCLQVEEVVDKEGNKIGICVFDAAGANKALELAGRSIGFWQDKLKLDATLAMTIEERLDKLRKDREMAMREAVEAGEDMPHLTDRFSQFEKNE